MFSRLFRPVSSGEGAYPRLPGGVWALGLVSLLMDTSSELIHSLLPVLLTTVLGASMATVGVIEGIAEATAAFAKVFSGALSDLRGKRKSIVVLGYGLAAATKPLFALAPSVGWVFGARFLDRVGKGIRGAPRDALVADMVDPRLRGAAYGLRQALDSVGALLGPLFAVVLMVLLGNDIRSVLWAAVVPAIFAVLLLVAAVREPGAPARRTGDARRLSPADAKRLPMRYWAVVILGAVFALARFSEAFLVLRAQDLGLAIAYVPGIMIAMNAAYSLFAYPAGAASDRIAPRKLLVGGLGVLVVADLVLAVAASPLAAVFGAVLWGLHMALTQGLLAKLVADTAPVDLRGTAFGVFNLVNGGALLLASVVAGALWDAFGASATFVAGASFAGLAALGLTFFRVKRCRR